MKSTIPQGRFGMKPIVPWAAASTLVATVFFGSTTAFAAPPPANTIIGNQASAGYVDPNGLSQTVTSNQVQTTVQQVGSFTLDTVNQMTTTVVNTKTGAAGAVIYAPHVLTNTGNGADTFTISVAAGPNGTGAFSNVAVYLDGGGGLPSGPALCSVTSGSCSMPAQQVVGNNGTLAFVVAYTIPSTATTPTTPYASGLVTATPATAALYGAPNTTAADVDNVNLTTAAAFSLTKAVSQPNAGITAPGGGAWPAVTATGKRSSSASCATTWSAGLTSSASCQYTVYTLTYSNTGGAAGRFNLQDVIGSGATAGFTYVSGSTVWSGAPSTALSESGSGLPSGVDFKVSGNTMTFVDNSLPVNTTRSVSFVVLVNNTAAAGTSTTANTATFDPVDATGATAAAPVSVTASNTNAAVFTVQGTYSISVGSATSTATTAQDTTPGTPNAGSADTTTVAAAPAGTQVSFSQVVYNLGNSTDTINLSASNPGTVGGTAFPTGTTFSFYRADGTTPLVDTNGDGIVDTGPVTSGGNVTIVVKAQLPSALTTPAGPFSFTLTGTSAGDATQTDATRDVVTTVNGVTVDLTNTAAGTTGASGDLGTGPSTSPTTTNTVQAGSTTVFSLFVKNNDTIANSYNLAASATANFPGTLPIGWTVKFVAGNVVTAGCSAASAITNTGSVAAGAQVQLTACVTPPSSQVPVTAQPVYFQVVSTALASTGSTVIDTKYDAVTVTAIAGQCSLTFGPPGSNQVGPGGSVVYAHTLNNVGGAAGTGSYTVTATPSAAGVTAGWTTAVYVDNGTLPGQLDAGDTLVTGPFAGPLPASGSQGLLVKVFAPGGATVGAADTATVTVNFPGCSGTTTVSTSDASEVVAGQIRLLKTQALDTACNGGGSVLSSLSANPISGAKPSQCIVYRVIATNQGTATAKNLNIADAVPAYTALNGTQPTTTCTSSGVTPALTNTNFSSSAASVSCGSASNSVAPGGTAAMTFEVQINH